MCSCTWIHMHLTMYANTCVANMMSHTLASSSTHSVKNPTTRNGVFFLLQWNFCCIQCESLAACNKIKCNATQSSLKTATRTTVVVRDFLHRERASRANYASELCSGTHISTVFQFIFWMWISYRLNIKISSNRQKLLFRHWNWTKFPTICFIWRF